MNDTVLKIASRSIFLSFLGTNDYVSCNYRLNDETAAEVRFIQEALIRLVCRDFQEPDRIVIFLTEKARQKNWLDSTDKDGKPIAGLAARLAATRKGELVQTVDIPDGDSPEELWRIFDKVFAVIEDGDRVYLDITHGFRSLPMLGVVLLNYARLLKNVTIAGIHYGAFETLGPGGRARDMPMEERNAPIFDLTAFADLLVWSSAAQEFVRHGSPFGIAKLLQQNAAPRLTDSKGNDAAAKVWSGASHYLKEIGGQIATCRGREIASGRSFDELRTYLYQSAELPDLPPPFRPLIRKIASKTVVFRKRDPENCLRAVDWCIEHDLIQQGITLLHEGMLSLMADRHGLDKCTRTDRELVAKAIAVKCKRTPKRSWDRELKERADVACRIHDDPVVKLLVKDFDRLGKIRNDINHGGFIEPKTPEGLKEELRRTSMEMQLVWDRYRDIPLPENEAHAATTRKGE